MNSQQSPSEFIDHIGNLIKDRQSKKLPTFYTIYIEQYGKSTPVAEREEGYENFKTQIMKYISDYNLTSIIVSFYTGKSRKVKNAFQTFRVNLHKNTPSTFVLGNTETDKDKEVAEITTSEHSISVHRYYDERFDWQMRFMKAEMEKSSLSERLTQLVEKYEDRIKAQDEKYNALIKDLEEEIRELENEKQDFEKEIYRYEKEKHNSIGNIALGSVGSRLIENLAKSDMGMGVLKGLLGKDGFDTLQGHLAGIENEKIIEPSKNTARVISEEDKSPRNVALRFIQQVGEQLSDQHLRMLYDLVEMSVKNIQDLETIWNVAGQIKAQREKPPVQDKTKKENTNDNELEEN